MTCRYSFSLGLMLSAVLVLLDPTASAVTVDWVTVGDPGNACETQTQGCFGAVAQSYRISRTEVTNAQYTEYLNAVAAADPNEVWGWGMGNQITRTGTSGSYSYSAGIGEENRALGFATFYHALRFANWMHNGQPIGAQGNSTTEDGAYTISPTGILNNSILRNPGATVFLTSEDEWYKAAYYDALSASYFDYPTGTNNVTGCALPGATPNTANCGPALGETSDVGSYTASASPYGTFDQGGNVWEWNESILSGSDRSFRGGGFWDNLAGTTLASSYQWGGDPSGVPGQGAPDFLGFRLGSLVPIPEPGTGLLMMMGLAGLAYGGRGRGHPRTHPRTTRD